MLDRPDVDTDQIMPKQFLKRIERTGFAEFLFFDWAKDPDFELNRPEAQGARILARRAELRLRLLARARALGLAGVRVRGDRRAVVRRHLPHELREDRARSYRPPPRSSVKALMEEQGEITVDLEAQTAGPYPFEFDAFERECLLQGLDDIDRALQHEDEIAAYEAAHPPRFATTAL